jgi:hypothetical protein
MIEITRPIQEITNATNASLTPELLSANTPVVLRVKSGGPELPETVLQSK